MKENQKFLKFHLKHLEQSIIISPNYFIKLSEEEEEEGEQEEGYFGVPGEILSFCPILFRSVSRPDDLHSHYSKDVYDNEQNQSKITQSSESGEDNVEQYFHCYPTLG